MEVASTGNQGARRSRNRRRRLRRLARLGMLCALMVFSSVWVISRVRTRRADRSHHTVPAASLYSDPPGIVLHSSMTPGKVHGIPIDADRLEQIHADDHPQWATTFEGKVYHIGYHYVILPDGTVQQGRPDHCIGCHAPHFNTWLGICLVGSFDPSNHHNWKPSRPTARQLAALIGLCERLMSEYHISPDRVLRHRDTKRTWCPGRRFPYTAVLTQLRQYSDLNPDTHAPQLISGVVTPPTLAAAGEGR